MKCIETRELMCDTGSSGSSGGYPQPSSCLSSSISIATTDEVGRRPTQPAEARAGLTEREGRRDGLDAPIAPGDSQRCHTDIIVVHQADISDEVDEGGEGSQKSPKLDEEAEDIEIGLKDEESQAVPPAKAKIRTEKKCSTKMKQKKKNLSKDSVVVTFPGEKPKNKMKREENEKEEIHEVQQGRDLVSAAGLPPTNLFTISLATERGRLWALLDQSSTTNWITFQAAQRLHLKPLARKQAAEINPGRIQLFRVKILIKNGEAKFVDCVGTRVVTKESRFRK